MEETTWNDFPEAMERRYSYSNAVLDEGTRRIAGEFTVEKYGHHNFSEEQRAQILDLAHSQLVAHLQVTGCLDGFVAADAIEGSLRFFGANGFYQSAK